MEEVYLPIIVTGDANHRREGEQSASKVLLMHIQQCRKAP
jgi:hypothetical protein